MVRCAEQFVSIIERHANQFRVNLSSAAIAVRNHLPANGQNLASRADHILDRHLALGGDNFGVRMQTQ